MCLIFYPFLILFCYFTFQFLIIFNFHITKKLHFKNVSRPTSLRNADVGYIESKGGDYEKWIKNRGWIIVRYCSGIYMNRLKRNISEENWRPWLESDSESPEFGARILSITMSSVHIIAMVRSIERLLRARRLGLNLRYCDFSRTNVTYTPTNRLGQVLLPWERTGRAWGWAVSFCKDAWNVVSMIETSILAWE
jgi:hypothetical protein